MSVVVPDNIFNYAHSDLTKLSKIFSEAKPFPHIVLDNAIDNNFITEVEKSFLDLSKVKGAANGDNAVTDIKLASRNGDEQLPGYIKILSWYLNSHQFIKFLQNVTGIKETLIPDPHLLGGGMHETKQGGFLKVHSDFSKHTATKLDRRVNVIVYLNRGWNESYGGALELWDSEMKECVVNVTPLFNRMVIFSTNDFTYHGHPDPLSCPDSKSRRSLAFYYYSNGRPKAELRHSSMGHMTFWKERPDEHFAATFSSIRHLLDLLTPPIFPLLIKRIRSAKEAN